MCNGAWQNQIYLPATFPAIISLLWLVMHFLGSYQVQMRCRGQPAHDTMRNPMVWSAYRFSPANRGIRGANRHLNAAAGECSGGGQGTPLPLARELIGLGFIPRPIEPISLLNPQCGLCGTGTRRRVQLSPPKEHRAMNTAATDTVRTRGTPPQTKHGTIPATPAPEQASRMVTPKILLALAALLAPLGLSEAIMRVEGYQPLGALADGRAPILTVSTNPDIVYELTPGSHGTAWGCDVQINSHGFRDREYSLAPPEGAFRVAVLGDSITFGNHMPASATFTEQLEARMADQGVEVLNLGVGGYDTLNEAALLEEHGVSFSPDLVVIGYCINDVGVYSTNLTYIKSLERYSSAIYNLRVFQYMGVQADRQKLAEDMATANQGEDFLRTYAGRIADVSGDAELEQLQNKLANWMAANPQPGRGHGFIGSYTEPARVGRIRYGLDWIQRLADENGFKALLVPIPLINETNHPEAYDLVHEIVEREGRLAGMDVLNVREAFEGLTAEDLRVRERDTVHLNPFGHKILAEELENWLRQHEFRVALGE
ncbi:MAG: hypothetical protein CMK00_04760 [Planctomycetes bacterium]|nr:hypothetical protein [Planctomycetota bacterium]